MNLPKNTSPYEMEGFTLRHLEEKDIPQMLAMQALVLNALPNPRWYFPSEEWEFAKVVAGREGFGYFQGDTLCAFAELTPGEERGAWGYSQKLGLPEEASFDFHDVMVLPQLRGRGMHTRFLHLFADMAQEAGGYAIFSTVDPENMPSRHNFEKTGYTPVMRKPAYDGRERIYYALWLNMEIVFTTKEDPRYLALAKELDKSLDAAMGAVTQRAVYDRLNGSEQLTHVALALRDGQAVGCAALKPHGPGEAEMKRVYVKPACRGSGVASALVLALRYLAAQEGIHALVLETGRALTGAISLYKSLGFTKIDNFPPYDGLETSLCFRFSMEQEWAKTDA